MTSVVIKPTWRMRRFLLWFVAPMLIPGLAVRTPGAIAFTLTCVAAYGGLCYALACRTLVVDDAGVTLHGWLRVRF